MYNVDELKNSSFYIPLREEDKNDVIKLLLSILKDHEKKEKFRCIEGINGEGCDDCPIASINTKFGNICPREEYGE
jgi:hypothetical protein